MATIQAIDLEVGTEIVINNVESLVVFVALQRGTHVQITYRARSPFRSPERSLTVPKNNSFHLVG